MRSDLDRAGVDQLPPELRHEERVAAGEVADGRDELVGRLDTGREADELADLALRQAAEPDADDALRAVRRRRASRRGSRGRRRRRRGTSRRGASARRRPERTRCRVSWSVDASAQWRSSSTSRSGASELMPTSRSVTAVWRRWRSVSASAAPGPAARRPARRGRAGAAPARRLRRRGADGASSGSVCRTRCSSAIAYGPYGEPTTPSQSP